MIIIESMSRSQFSLDVVLDKLLIKNNLTRKVINVPLDSSEGHVLYIASGIYYTYEGDFSGIKPGEYNYEAYKDGRLVQVGLLQLAMPGGKDPDPNVENNGQLTESQVSKAPEVITYKP